MKIFQIKINIPSNSISYMLEVTINYKLERNVAKADKWWSNLPDVTRVAIWEDLQGIESF